MSETVSFRRVTDLQSPLIERVTQVKLAAGEKDGSGLAFSWGNQNLAYEFWKSNTRAQVVGGHLIVASVGDEENVVGCVAFFGPGKASMADEEQMSVGLNDFIAKLPAKHLQVIKNDFKPSYTAIADAVLGGPETKLMSWSMNSFFVLPEYRGRGIGRGLVQQGEVLAKKDGLPLFVECQPHNKEMYLHLGFEALGEGLLRVGAPQLKEVMLTILRKEFKEEQ